MYNILIIFINIIFNSNIFNIDIIIINININGCMLYILHQNDIILLAKSVLSVIYILTAFPCCCFVQALPKEIIALPGNEIVLHVEISSLPHPIVKWYRDGVEIVNSEDYMLKQDGVVYSLSIQEVFPEDAGMFSVVATNVDGSAFSETNLRVEGIFHNNFFMQFILAFYSLNAILPFFFIFNTV